MSDLTSLQGIFSSFLSGGTVFSDEYNELCCSDCQQSIEVIPGLSISDLPISGLTTPIQPTNNGLFNVYVFCSSDSFNTFMDILGIGSQEYPFQLLECCLHVNGSTSSINSINSGGEGIPNNFKNCSTNFNSCVTQLKNTLTPSDIESINNLGIVEYGSISGQSQVCLIKEFVNYAYDNRDDLSVTKGDILSNILNEGIVIACFDNEISISNLETFGDWYSTYVNPPA
jgi:hypothetical protein